MSSINAVIAFYKVDAQPLGWVIGEENPFEIITFVFSNRIAESNERRVGRSGPARVPEGQL